MRASYRWKVRKGWRWVIAVAVLAWAGYVQFRTLMQEGFFDADSGIIVNGALDIIRGERFPLVGTGPNRYGQYTVGPIVYLLYVPALLLRATPMVAQAYTVMLQLLTQALVFVIVRKVSGGRTWGALLALVLYAFHYETILWSGIVWNITLIPLFTCIFLLGLLGVWERRYWMMPAVLMAPVAAWQLHGVAVALVLSGGVAGVLAWLRELTYAERRWQALACATGVGLVGVGLLMVPPLIDALQHGGGNLRALLAFMRAHSGGTAGGWQWGRAWEQFRAAWFHGLLPGSGGHWTGRVLWYATLMVLAMECVARGMAIVRGRAWNVPVWWLLWLVPAGYFVVYATFDSMVPTEYNLAFLVVVPVVVGTVYGRWQKMLGRIIVEPVAGVVLAVCATWIAAPLVAGNLRMVRDIPARYAYHIPYAELRRVVQMIGEETKGMPFTYVHAEQWQPGGEHMRAMFRCSRLPAVIAAPSALHARYPKPIYVFNAPRRAACDYGALAALQQLPSRTTGRGRLDTFSVPAAFPHVLDLGTIQADPYLGIGWYGNEMWGERTMVWSGTSADILVPAAPRAIGALTAICAAYQYAGAPENSVTLVVNGRDCGTRTLSASDVVKVRWELPTELLTNSVNRVTLCVRHAAVPAHVSNSDDQRRLGIVVDKIIFDAVEAP